MAALDHLIHTALTLYCVAVIAPRRTYSTVYLGVCMNDHGSSVRSSVERESTFKMKGARKVPVPTLDLMPNSAKNGIGLPFGLCAPRSSSILTSPRHLEQAAVATAFRFHLMQLASRKTHTFFLENEFKYRQALSLRQSWLHDRDSNACRMTCASDVI